jgi:putative N6-adenine-specific DNA methylase
MKRRIPLGAPGRKRSDEKKRGSSRKRGSAAAPDRTADDRLADPDFTPAGVKVNRKSAFVKRDRSVTPRTPTPRTRAAEPVRTAEPRPVRAQRVDELLSLFAISTPGLEEITAGELRALGIASAAVEPGGVAFTGTRDDLYRANLWLRTASRVVVRVASFHASEFHELERRARRVPWDRYIGVPARVRFRVTCRKSRLYHSDAVAERLAKVIEHGHGLAGGFAIAGADESANDDSSSHEVEGQLFVVRLVHDEVTISADTSGELLHRRGYRQAVVKAPLRETIAAAMLVGSGWTPEMPLVDPMCGSGTIAIEGAMMSRGMAPGIDHVQRRSRQFAFMNWPGFDDRAWNDRIAQALDAARPAVVAPIVAADRDAGAIAATRANAERAGVAGNIDVRQGAVSSLVLPDGRGAIVSNPPYGVRVGESAALRNLYAQLGKVARDRAHGWTLALLTADRALERQVGAPFEEVFRVSNGGIPVRLVRARID